MIVPLLRAEPGDRMLRLTARWADQSQMAWFGRPVLDAIARRKE